MGEEHRDEESPAEVAEKDAHALASVERVRLMREEHAKRRVLILRPLTEVAKHLPAER